MKTGTCILRASEGERDARRQTVLNLGDQHHAPPRKSEVTFQGPALLLGLPTPGDRKSAWSKVTAAPTTCPSPGARGREPGEPAPKVGEGRRGAGGERPGQRLPQPCPWTASAGSDPGEPG